MTQEKISVFGYGTIGRAFVNAIAEKGGAAPLIVDPGIGLDLYDSDFLGVSLAFVCVPTPTDKDGDQDLGAVRSVLDRLAGIRYSGLVVIRSTVTPVNVLRLEHEYQLRIATLPEFLTEKNAKEDALASPFFVVGCNREKDYEEIYDRFLIKLWPDSEYVFPSPAGAMLVKYWVNCCLASRVALANEFKLYWDAAGDGPWSIASDGFTLDPRCGGTHMDAPGPDGLPGFGGGCFPKDVYALAAEIGQYVEQWDGGVLEGMRAINYLVRPPETTEEE